MGKFTVNAHESLQWNSGQSVHHNKFKLLLYLQAQSGTWKCQSELPREDSKLSRETLNNLKETLNYVGRLNYLRRTLTYLGRLWIISGRLWIIVRRLWFVSVRLWITLRSLHWIALTAKNRSWVSEAISRLTRNEFKVWLKRFNQIL